MHNSGISIWFFIGVLLTIYGAMIFGYGIFELVTGTHGQRGAGQSACAGLVGRYHCWRSACFMACAFAPAATVNWNAVCKEQVRNGSTTNNDIWSDRRQSRIFSRPSGQDRPRRDHRGARGGGRARRSCLAPEESKYGAVETYAEAQRCAELFKKHRGRDRRHHRHAAQLRRRARHCRRDPPLRAEGSGAGAGHARPLRRHDHRHAPRQLLRQDERLQQPDAVRHSVLADHAAHREPDFGGVQGRSRVVLRGLPHREGTEESAHRRHRRASRGLQHGALLRAHLGDQRHLGRDPSICRRSSAASTA